MDTKDPLKLEDNKESIRSYVYKESLYTSLKKREAQIHVSGLVPLLDFYINSFLPREKFRIGGSFFLSTLFKSLLQFEDHKR